MSLGVDADIDADEDLSGKYVTDLQSDIAVSDLSITGTLKYVSDYTGFSEDSDEQKGNFLALHAEYDGADSITVQYDGDPITLTEDGLVVLRITDLDTPVVFQATVDETVVTRRLDISALVLEEAV